MEDRSVRKILIDRHTQKERERERWDVKRV